MAALAWPLARLWMRDGVFGLVAWRERSPHQLLNGALFAATNVGFVAVALASPARSPSGVAAVGGLVALAGTAVIVAAQAQMGASWRIGIDDRPTELVERGLYRFSRHPIYTGLLVWCAGVWLVVPTLAGAVLGLAVALTVDRRARLEEAHLVAEHGDRYRAYMQRVGRFFPPPR